MCGTSADVPGSAVTSDVTVNGDSYKREPRAKGTEHCIAADGVVIGMFAQSRVGSRGLPRICVAYLRAMLKPLENKIVNEPRKLRLAIDYARA